MTQYNHNYITDMTSNFRGVYFWEAPTPVSRSNDPIWVIGFAEYTLVKGLPGHVGISVPFEGVCGRGCEWGRMVCLVPPKCVLRRGVFGGSYLWLCGSNHSDSFIFRKSEIRRPILGFGKKQLRRKRPFFAIFERGSIFFHWKKGQSTY